MIQLPHEPLGRPPLGNSQSDGFCGDRSQFLCCVLDAGRVIASMSDVVNYMRKPLQLRKKPLSFVHAGVVGRADREVKIGSHTASLHLFEA